MTQWNWRSWLERHSRSTRARGITLRARAARPMLETLEDRTMPSAVWYVNGAATGTADGHSWANALTNLQPALAAAQPGDQIWVAQGVYKPTAGADRTASFALKDGVAIYGGFAGTETQLAQRDVVHNLTTLSGNLDGTPADASYHVVTAANVGTTALLDGFTIAGGNANGSVGNDSGGGIDAVHASPTLSNLVVSGNTAANVGGGIADRSVSAPTLTNVVFKGNSAATGGGLSNGDGSSPTLTNVVFWHNTGSSAGGGMFDQGTSAPTLMNVTFNGNTAANGGAIANNGPGLPTLTNSILWGDQGGEIAGSATVATSDVADASGTGNLNDPQFVDAAHGDLHLNAGSPAIDAGTSVGAPTTDLDGLPRDAAATTDLGAYEYQPVLVQTLAPAVGQANPTTAATVHFQVVFSQLVTGFAATGVQLSGTAGATTVVITGSGTTYDLAVSGMTHDGTVIVNIPANVARDGEEGNEASTSTTNSVVYDVTPPVTTLTLAGTHGQNGWYTGPVQVTLAATDAGSGVATTTYQLDGGAATAYTAPFTVSADGTHTINFHSVDNAGNIEATETISFKVDHVAPVTTAALTGTAGTNGWYTGPVQVTLAATDATSGVAHKFYKLDNGTLTPYTATFNVHGDGSHTVAFYSVDSAGNPETLESKTIKIDTVAPRTTINLAGAHNYTGWYTSAVQVTLTTADATSGVAATYYQLDGGARTAYTGPFTVHSQGHHTLTFLSVDRAGNIEHTDSATFKLDSVGPTTTATLTGTAGTNGWFTSAVRVTLTGTAPAGIFETFYRIDNGPLKLYTVPFTVSGQGNHTIVYNSVDWAANVEKTETTHVRIDSVPPIVGVYTLLPVNVVNVNHLALSGYAAPGVTVSVRITDSHNHSLTASTIADGGWLWSINQLNASSLADGILTVRVTATDQAGNTTIVTRTTTKSMQLVLAFVWEPGNAPANTALTAIVQLHDAYGNNVPYTLQTITLTLPSGTLNGTRWAYTNGQGKAVFNGLHIPTPGVYRLHATGAGMTAAWSNWFTVTAAGTAHAPHPPA